VNGTRVLRAARLPDYGDDGRYEDDYADDAFFAPTRKAPALTAEVGTDFEAQLWTDAPGVSTPHAERAPLPPLERDDEHHAAAAAVTQNAMRGLFGRDAAYLLVVASQAALAALSIPITTRILKGPQFAVVQTSLAVMQVLVAVGVFALPLAIQRNYRDEDGGRAARRTISLAIVTAATTLVISYATGPLWAPALGLGTFGPALRYAVIWAAVTAVTFAAIALLRSKNTLRAYALISFIQSLLAEIVSVLLVVFVRRTAAEFILGELIMQVVAAVLVLYMTRPLPLRRRDLKLISSSLKYASGLLPASVASFLLAASDRIIIRHDLPILEVARYGAVYNIAAIPVLLLGLLDPVWLPRFFKLRDPQLRARLLADSRDVLFRLLIPTVMGLGFGIPLVLAVWVPGYYHPAGLVIVVVTISAGAFPMAGFVSANRVLLISGRTAPVGLCMVLAAGFNIAANIILVPVMGIEGSAIATSGAYVLLMLLGTFFAFRIQRLRHPPLPLLLGSAAAIAVALSCAVLPSTGAFAVARAILTVACVVVAIALLRDVIREGSGRWPAFLSRRPARR
jgi:O-antigen/teichoic acid export membrane protein